MKKPCIHIAIALATVIAATQSFGTLITQNFDTDPGWTSVNTTEDGSSYGFSNTGNVTGNAGEAGGLFTRSDTEGFYGDADTFVNGLDADDKMFATGRFRVTDESSGASQVQIGFLSASTVNRAFFGITIYDQGGADVFRVHLRSDPASGSPLKTTTLRTFNANDLFRFNFELDPTGGSFGEGQLILRLTNETLNQSFLDTVDLNAGEAAALTGLNVFGIGNGNQLTVNMADQITVFVDDLTYGTLPEPSTVVLLGLGGGMLWHRGRRNRNARK